MNDKMYLVVRVMMYSVLGYVVSTTNASIWHAIVTFAIVLVIEVLSSFQGEMYIINKAAQNEKTSIYS